MSVGRTGATTKKRINLGDDKAFVRIVDLLTRHDIVQDQVDTRLLTEVSHGVILPIVDFPDFPGSEMLNLSVNPEIDKLIGDNREMIAMRSQNGFAMVPMGANNGARA